MATPFQATAESLRTFAAVGTSGSVTTAAQSFLANEPDHNTEYLARRIIAESDAGQNVSTLIIELLTHQDATSGGFAGLTDYQPTVLDTAWALDALTTSSPLTSSATGAAVGFLQQQQASNGAWSDAGNDPSVYLSALSLSALNHYAGAYRLAATLQAGSTFLLSVRQTDGLWGEDFLNAENLIALLGTLFDVTPIQTSVTALQAHQATNGSWGTDSFTTALALRAWQLAQTRIGGGGNGAGAVDGTITRVGSAQPIAGATVSVPSIPGLSVQTNSDGYFLLTGLPVGSLTLVISKPGFGSVSVVAIVTAGHNATVAGVALPLDSQTGSLRLQLVDAITGAALSGVTAQVTGPSSTLSGTTDTQGIVEFDGLTPGNYTVIVQGTGYPSQQTAVTVVAGQSLTLIQPLFTSTNPSSGPASLTGRVVDATTGATLAGARFTLAGTVATTDIGGRFNLSGLTGGSVTAILDANGYVSQTLTITLPAGLTSDLGILRLYPATTTIAPTTVNLLGTFVDGVTHQPVVGATVTVLGTPVTGTSDTHGQVTLSGIPALSFQLQVAASGYVATTFNVTASAFGSVAGTFSLPQVGSGGTAIILQGRVTDVLSGVAIAGATVQIPGTSFSIQTDTAGHYQLTGLTGLQFQVQVSAPTYITQTLGETLSSLGLYNLDVALTPAPATAGAFQILSVTANDSGQGANQTQRFTAKIVNLTASQADGVVIGHILDSNGQSVGDVTPYAPGTQTSQSLFSFAANETKTLTIPWNPAQTPPAAYTLQLNVIVPGSIIRNNPAGTVLAASTAITQVSPTPALTGTLAFQPPLAQAGSATPVDLSVLVVNAGNVPLDHTQLTLTISNVQETWVYTAQAQIPTLAVGNFEYVSFGSWTPTASGNLAVTVAAQDGTQGQITGTLYVGDRPQGSVTVTPTTVFTGDQTIHATLNITGVDKALNVSDPLVYAIRNAVQKGSQYIATNVVIDQKSTECLRCHVQAQSYYGLASLANHDIGSDPTTTQFVYNTLVSSQQSDGSLRDSQWQYAEIQTSLALWALTKSQDKLSSFPVKYKGALFMQSRLNTVGSNKYWSPDYGLGWWASVDGNNMLGVTGYVDLLLTAQNNDISQVPDYTLSTPVAYHNSASGLVPGSDGILYTIDYTGRRVLRYDTASATAQTVVSGLPSDCQSLLPLATQEFMVDCSNQLLHIQNGTSQVVATLGAYPGAMVLGNDGDVYVADTNNQRILRGPPTGPFTVYVAGGLLNLPTGLSFGPDGALYVSNRGAFNLLKIALDTTVSVFADGLAYPPRCISVQPDGSVYVAHYDYQDSATWQTTSGGLFVVTPQGVVRRVATFSQLNGMAAVHGQVSLVDQNGNLCTLVTQSLDTSQLPAMRTTVTGVVNYVLSEYHNSPSIHQLITLGEARKIITDPALLAQVNQAITELDALIRSRQKADGGWWWSSSSQPSDALATALVGLGLEYQSPPADDPALLKAVQFLLNSQATDGSWVSADGIMATRFAATGLVMAFLPRVLDKLGGLSVEAHLDLPANVTLSNPSLPPSSVLPTTDGGMSYTWALPGVTSQGRTVTFDLTLAAMQANESRPVARAAYLLSINSFDSSQVRVDLAVPVVQASAGLSLDAVQTDRPSYPANSTALLTAQVTNHAPVAQSGTVVFTIRDTNGSTVATLSPVPFTNLTPVTATPIIASWPTGTALAGFYTVVVDLYTSTQTRVSEQTLPLTVIPTNVNGTTTQVTLRVTMDKATYNTTDQVQITGLIQNVTINALVDHAALQLQILGPTGNLVFTHTTPLGQLVPGAVLPLATSYAFSATAQGTYQVTGTVIDGAGMVLASGTSQYQVQENLAMTITATEKVASPALYQGDPQVCIEVVTNHGTQAVATLALTQLVVNLDTNAVDQQTALTANLDSGASHTYVRSLDTTSLAVGHHACVIQAHLNGTDQPLANAPFTVQQPPVRVEGRLQLGRHGRLLILLDGNTPSGNAPHDHNETLTADQQQAWLKTFLTQAGWSYTIVTTADDFTRELRNGGYATYLLLAEYQPLQEQVDKELREHINVGEGLYVTGWPDPNHSVLDVLVGVQSKGQQPCPQGIMMGNANVFGLSGQIGFTQSQPVQRINLHGATTDATVVGNCLTQSDPTSLVTHQSYGIGRAVYAGFDLLAEASVVNSIGLLNDLVRQPLNYVTQQADPPLAGRVVPVQLTVTNDGIANTTKVTVTISAGNQIAADTGTLVNGQLTATLTLAAGGIQTITVWVRLPASGTVTVTATLVANNGNLIADPVMVTTKLAPMSLPGLSAAISDLTTYLATLPKNLQSPGKQALNFLQQASKQLGLGNTQTALNQLVQATDQLLSSDDPALVLIRLEADEALIQVEKLP